MYRLIYKPYIIYLLYANLIIYFKFYTEYKWFLVMFCHIIFLIWLDIALLENNTYNYLETPGTLSKNDFNIFF